jgi:NAD(P)-dependent dehydrogenase (short-subunit alcohol dehydrogenase family)
VQEPDLRGKTALVTGGGRGIGRETALKLARCGARVIVTARHPEEIDAVAREIARAGGEADAIPCDVSRDTLVERLFDASGPIDILINNAGTVHPIAPVVDADVLAWEESIAVNLTGVFLTCRYALPHMLNADWGRIVNVSSGAARGSVTNWSAYSAGKAGVETLTKVLAAELKGTGIRVNAMRPGKVDTEMQVDIRSSTAEQFGSENLALYRGFKERGELRPPEHPARLILWMLSDEAAHLNGEVLLLDDPETARRVGLEPRGR